MNAINQAWREWVLRAGMAGYLAFVFAVSAINPESYMLRGLVLIAGGVYILYAAFYSVFFLYRGDDIALQKIPLLQRLVLGFGSRTPEVDYSIKKTSFHWLVVLFLCCVFLYSMVDLYSYVASRNQILFPQIFQQIQTILLEQGLNPVMSADPLFHYIVWKTGSFIAAVFIFYFAFFIARYYPFSSVFFGILCALAGISFIHLLWRGFHDLYMFPFYLAAMSVMGFALGRLSVPLRKKYTLYN